MGAFIIGGLSTNKEVNREIVVVSGHWEFRASKLEGLLRASRVHGIPSKYFELLFRVFVVVWGFLRS